MPDLLPEIHHACILRIDINHVAHDFVLRHAGATIEQPYALADHPAVLRQETLPDDAKVLFAAVDPPEAGKDDALRAARAYILSHRTEGDDPAAIEALIQAAIALPSARMLVVGVESATFAAVKRGDEPELPFDYAAFAPSGEE